MASPGRTEPVRAGATRSRGGAPSHHAAVAGWGERIRALFSLVRQAARHFLDDDCPSLAAALSYYTAFSLPPLLMLILLVFGLVIDPETIRDALGTQVERLMGPAGAAQVAVLLTREPDIDGRHLVSTVAGIATLAFGATGAFLSLQSALNRAWEVTPDPAQGGIRRFLVKRLFSFGMLLAIAFLLLVSLVVTAVLSAVGDALVGFLPDPWSGHALQAFNLLVTFPILALLFGVILKWIPDAKVPNDAVVRGALVTAALFALGKFVIGFYLGRSNPGEPFGAAGSLALLLVWIYYSSMILLLGAEFTQAIALARGEAIEPDRGALHAPRRPTPAREVKARAR